MTYTKKLHRLNELIGRTYVDYLLQLHSEWANRLHVDRFIDWKYRLSISGTPYHFADTILSEAIGGSTPKTTHSRIRESLFNEVWNPVTSTQDLSQAVDNGVNVTSEYTSEVVCTCSGTQMLSGIWDTECKYHSNNKT